MRREDSVHGLFVDGAEDKLRQSGATRIVTADGIPHDSNGVALAGLLARGLRSLLADSPQGSS